MKLETFIEELYYYLDDSFLNSELTNTVRAFVKTKSYRVLNDSKANAMAYIDMINNKIVFNPVLIATCLYDLRKELKLVTKSDSFDYACKANALTICRCIKTFLLLHEIGHWLYTCDPRDVIPLVKQYCSNMPTELCMFLYNVVEDSVIERLFMLDYRGTFYRQCFNIGICCFQGAEAVKTYVSNSEEQSWSIKTKLFYFIIRAYNLHNSEVQNMFNIPDKIGWKDDTIKAFDQAIVTIDKNDRAKYCFEVLAPLVFRDLLEEVDNSQTTTGPVTGSLLDQDKLYTSNEEPQPSDVDPGVPGSSSTSSQQSSPSNSPSSGESNEEDTNEEDVDEPSSTDGTSITEASIDDATEDVKGSGEDDSDSEGDSDGNSEGNSEADSECDGDEPGNGASDGEDSEEDSEDESEDDTDGTPGSSSKESEPEELPEVKPEEPARNLIQEITDACKELNKGINASDEPSDTVSPLKLKPQNTTALACGIKDHTTGAGLSGQPLSMNKLTLEIYGNALNVLDKIFTMNDEVLRGLDQGELDEDELYTYYTEKNLNIYKEEHKLKKDKKVVCYFVLDNSGSMMGKRFDYSSAAFIGLIHALEDIQIKCCLLSFGEDTRLIKRFEESLSALGTESLLAGRIQHYVSNLEDDTLLYPALDYILADSTFQDPDPDLCKVVVVATDGCTRNEGACSALAEQISEDALMFAVGLDMKGQEKYLQRVMPGSIVKVYSGEDIATQLPEDIYEAIIEKFLLY